MVTAVKRSQERLVFYYKTANTATTVKRETLQQAAQELGLDETGFLHLAAAQMLRTLKSGSFPPNEPGDGARLSDAQIAAIREMEPQSFKPTRSFLDLLNR